MLAVGIFCALIRFCGPAAPVYRRSAPAVASLAGASSSFCCRRCRRLDIVVRVNFFRLRAFFLSSRAFRAASATGSLPIVARNPAIARTSPYPPRIAFGTIIKNFIQAFMVI